MISIISRSSRETVQIGKTLARKLKGWETLALFGDLGSGKTTFAKGLARGLGIRKKITSPTFVFFRPYPFAGKTFYHFDLYRLKRARELEELGIVEILQNPKSIMAIEWPEKTKRFLPPGTVFIRLRCGAKANVRKIEIWQKK